MALTGNEVLWVVPVAANGALAATQLQTTAQAIANLASAGGTNAVVTALNTVGNGTITAAGIVGRVTSRGGSQSATPFTDTTASAAAIITALVDGVIGQSFQYTYCNTTNATATITGGSDVTVSVITVIPQNSFVRYLVTYTAANTVTMVGIESGTLANPVSVTSGKTLAATNSLTLSGTDATTMTFPSSSDTVVTLGATQTLTNKTLTSPTLNLATLTLAAAQVGTFTANGASSVTVNNAAVTANSSIIFTLKTVGGTVGAYPSIKTITPSTGFTVACTASDTSVYNYAIIG